jgi:hypothetical protein
MPRSNNKRSKKESRKVPFLNPASATTQSAHPTVVRQKQRVSPEGADTCLPYCQSYYLSSAGTYQAQQFRMNSPHDFDYTGTGEQPDGYDQWTAFFTLYKCYKTEIEITVIPTSKALGLVFYNTPNTTISSTIENALSQKSAVGVVCGIYDTKSVKHTIVMADFFGADFSEFGSSLYGASVGTNPAAICYGTVDVFNIDNSAVISCYILVKAKLYVQFTSPGYLGISLNRKSDATPPSRNEPTSKALGVPVNESHLIKPEDSVTPTSGLEVSKPRRTFKQILAEFDLID